MKLTINDIAKLCGVGKSTVSRVLNHDPKVNPITREKVLSVIEQYHFQPSRSARAMRGIATKVIGIIVTRLDSPSENRVLRGILHSLQKKGYEHFVLESRFETKLVKEHLLFLNQRHVDGIIVFAFSGLDQTDLLPYSEKMVAIARRYDAVSSIYYDDYGAISQLLDYLYREKHRHIVYIGVNEQDQTTGYLRYSAYLDFCVKHRLSPVSALGELDYLTGYEKAKEILQPETSAIVCATDSIALGVNKYLAEQQRKDIQVCSVGNNQLLKFLFPATISIHFGFFTAGQRAVNMLIEVLNGRDSVEHFCIKSNFI